MSMCDMVILFYSIVGIEFCLAFDVLFVLSNLLKREIRVEADE